MRFIPSRAWVLGLAATSLLWLLVLIVPWAGWIAAGVVLGWTALAVWEALRGPQSRDLDVERDWPAKLSAGLELEGRLVLGNRSTQTIWLVLRDELAPEVDLLGRLPRVRLEAGGEVSVPYPFRVKRRGKVVLGHVILRVSWGMGLVERDFSYLAPQVVKVYPRFQEVEDYELLAKLDQRDEVVRHPRKVRGEGKEFESLRPYVQGEDPRKLDWKASARRGVLMSRNHQIEKGQQIAVLIDAGRYMGEMLGEWTRLDHAIQATVLLGYVAGKRGDTFSVASFSNRLESFQPPVRGAGILPKVLENLYAVEARPVESDYWMVTAEVLGMLKKRSLVIVFTDVLDVAGSEGLMNNLRRASKRHLVLCVVLVEPRLREVARSSPQNAEDVFRKAAACDVLRRRRLALEHMTSKGIMVLESEPRRLSIALVRRYLEIRRADLQ